MALEHGPDALLVIRNVNSAAVPSIVVVQLGVWLIHAQVGRRGFDSSMPVAINCVLINSISDLSFCSEQSDVDNLRKESHDGDNVAPIGNVMYRTGSQSQQPPITHP